MEILNTRIEGPNIALIILGAVLICLAFFILYRCINYLRWKANATAFFCFLGFVLALCLGVALLRNNIAQNTTVYDVMVKDEDDLREMKKDYIIIRQSGVIYTVKPKKETIKFIDEKTRK